MILTMSDLSLEYFSNYVAKDSFFWNFLGLMVAILVSDWESNDLLFLLIDALKEVVWGVARALLSWKAGDLALTISLDL